MEDKYFGFIYETTNLINGIKYIGKCIFKRQNNWKTYLGSGTYLKRAIKKYGKENFKREILFLALDNEELNELEEFIIKISDAVESSNYYNLKITSIGGDVFTYNPRKEEIREIRRQQFSGEGNYWYGREKPSYIIQSIKEANSKKIIADGVLYDSITECAKLTGLKISTIHARLNSDTNDKFFYADKYGNTIPKRLRNKKINSSKKPVKIKIEGKIFNSKKEARKELHIGQATLEKMISEGRCKIVD
ncbi:MULTISPECIES: hypothetical protein [Bacillota]|uniref:hypothetical protein n=1 Tax=Bacillota TaxID=1239 RepID=UPI0021C35057|nr:hypothetical protein [Bacillus licheniformis]MDE1407112.1 hypothetical protein [Bacillus licheniformis]